ncbi:MAG: ROK family protein [Armatimonadetes bacterium]|nr:ROK family protein [Armatimonadota bacterium]
MAVSESEGNMEKPFVIGIDLGGTNLRTVLSDREGEILQEARRPSESEGPPEGTLRQMVSAVEEVIAKQQAAAESVVGIGIGLPGIMDSKTGIVYWSPNFPLWKEVHVGPEMERKLRLKTTILNDARCAAMGEMTFGAGRGVRNLVMITLGTGIGGAIAVDGRLLLGPNGSIGEVGHHTIDPDGPVCGCGTFGCWEAFCGKQGIIDRAVRKLQRGRKSLLAERTDARWGLLDPAMIAGAARAGDPLACEVIEETGFYVGVGVANLITMLNPEVFIIGGGVAQAGDLLFEPVRRTVRARAVRLQADTARIVSAELGDSAGVKGGVALALKGLE